MRQKKRKKRKYLSQEERLEVSRLHYLEGKKQRELAKMYDIDQSTVSDILRKFASENDKSALFMKKDLKASESDEIKALQRENMELRKKLCDETMRADFYDTMIDVAEEMFNIEIRKKAGTGQSKGCTERSSTK